MWPGHFMVTGLITIGCTWSVQGQNTDTLFYLSAIVYNEGFYPLSGTHILNAGLHTASTADELGIFRLKVRSSDTLLFTNIAYRDTLVPVVSLAKFGYLILQEQRYALPGVKIFPWGASYGDLLRAVASMPMQPDLGASLGLPRAVPGYIPIEMDEDRVSGAGYLLSSPVSFFYQNFNRKARSARKVYWLEKNREKIEIFEALMSRENMAGITGLSGDELNGFITYLEEHMICDFKCSEIAVLTEVYAHFEKYTESK